MHRRVATGRRTIEAINRTEEGSWRAEQTESEAHPLKVHHPSIRTFDSCFMFLHGPSPTAPSDPSGRVGDEADVEPGRGAGTATMGRESSRIEPRREEDLLDSSARMAKRGQKFCQRPFSTLRNNWDPTRFGIVVDGLRHRPKRIEE